MRHINYYFSIALIIVFRGWLKVAEDMLHPLGDEFGNFECNYIIDKNLITGLALVDNPELSFPELKKDAFWDKKKIIPLHTFETAQKSVSSMDGTASNVKYAFFYCFVQFNIIFSFVKSSDNISMVPHKSKLITMTQEEQVCFT